MSITLRVVQLLCGAALCLIVAGCSRDQIPPADQFQAPAIGTLLPEQHEESVRPDLAADVGGVLMINQTGVEVRVAVSSTIAAIPANSSFLFLLPPNIYQFYIYEPGMAPWSHSETVAGGKMRYVYLPVRGKGQ
jgi:hypothetical protein